MDGQLDTPLVGLLEQKFEKSRFSRVDADTIERLIPKEDTTKSDLTDEENNQLTGIFKSQLPALDKVDFHVELQPLGEEASPILITQNEWSRRMKEMSHLQQGMDFYGQMPDMYAVVLNARKQVLEQQQKDKKYDELTQQEKDDMSACEKSIGDEEKKRDDILAEYGHGNDKVQQLVDLALLQNGLLKGEALNKFLRRSIDLL